MKSETIMALFPISLGLFNACFSLLMPEPTAVSPPPPSQTPRAISRPISPLPSRDGRSWRIRSYIFFIHN